MRSKIPTLILLIFSLGGCAQSAEKPSSDFTYRARSPQKIVARVEGLLLVGRHIDFSDGLSADPHGIDLRVLEPKKNSSQKITILFYDLPVINGRRIELGDRLEFTIEKTDDSSSGLIFLENLPDAKLVNP